MHKDVLNLIQLLQSHRRGELVAAANASAQELIQAMKDTGGDGQIVIKIPFKHAKKGNHIEVTPTITVTKPNVPIGTGIYYLDEDDNALSRTDPRQLDIEDAIALRPAKRDE